jgi:hypothetical protein
MIEPGFYERVDLEAAVEAHDEFQLDHEMSTPEFVRRIVEAALVGVQPATVEGGELRMADDDDNTQPLSLVERLVSAWRPTERET